MARVLVTGANGFCGRHLVSRLKSMGHEVHTLGPRPTQENHHLARPDHLPGIIEAVVAARPERVFHLAGASQSAEFPEFYLANVLYGANLLRALEVAGLADTPTLLVGSAAEYGAILPEDLPIHEEIQCRPVHHYGISKWAQSRLALNEANRGRPIVVARAFNLVGPGMPEWLVAQAFASQIAKIEKGQLAPPIRVGNLSPTRDFLDVEDAVSAYLALLDNSQAYGQVVNVCSGVEVQVQSILATLLELATVPISVEVDPERFRTADIDRHFGSKEKLVRLTSLDPTFRMDDILTKVLDWNRENR